MEIVRIKKAYLRYQEAFLQKVYTQKEQEYCLQKKEPAPSLAARFTVKEAVVKALGTGFGEEISFLDIEVVQDRAGKPSVRLSARLQQKFHNPVLHVSISHCRDYATATVIWTDEDDKIKT